MKYEIVNQAARIPAGVLVLTKHQAVPRAHNLKALGKDRYEVVNPVEFKIGETIGYEGDLPKGMANELLSEKAKAEREKAAADTGQTVADLKKELEALGVAYNKNANKATLADLLAYATKVTNKAVELSGLSRDDYNALPPAEKDALIARAEEAPE